MAHAVLKTPGGEDLVVVARAEYDRLVEAAEMLDDVSAYDSAKAAMAAGLEKPVPIAVADALLAGDNPIRTWRVHRGLSANDLAKAVGVSIPYIYQLENGDRVGRVDRLVSIANVLGVTLDDLI